MKEYIVKCSCAKKNLLLQRWFEPILSQFSSSQIVCKTSQITKGCLLLCTIHGQHFFIFESCLVIQLFGLIFLKYSLTIKIRVQWNVINMLRQRYSSYYSRKILFDCQLWGSVKILPVDEIKIFLDVVNNYNVNFHMRK